MLTELFNRFVLQNKQILRGVFAVCIIVAGITHFIAPDTYVKIVPPQLPYPEAIVYISGFFEILGGIGLLVPLVKSGCCLGFSFIINCRISSQH